MSAPGAWWTLIYALCSIPSCAVSWQVYDLRLDAGAIAVQTLAYTVAAVSLRRLTSAGWPGVLLAMLLPLLVEARVHPIGSAFAVALAAIGLLGVLDSRRGVRLGSYVLCGMAGAWLVCGPYVAAASHGRPTVYALHRDLVLLMPLILLALISLADAGPRRRQPAARRWLHAATHLGLLGVALASLGIPLDTRVLGLLLCTALGSRSQPVSAGQQALTLARAACVVVVLLFAIRPLRLWSEAVALLWGMWLT